MSISDWTKGVREHDDDAWAKLASLAANVGHDPARVRKWVADLSAEDKLTWADVVTDAHAAEVTAYRDALAEALRDPSLLSDIPMLTHDALAATHAHAEAVAALHARERIERLVEVSAVLGHPVARSTVEDLDRRARPVLEPLLDQWAPDLSALTQSLSAGARRARWWMRFGEGGDADEIDLPTLDAVAEWVDARRVDGRLHLDDVESERLRQTEGGAALVAYLGDTVRVEPRMVSTGDLIDGLIASGRSRVQEVASTLRARPVEPAVVTSAASFEVAATGQAALVGFRSRASSLVDGLGIVAVGPYHGDRGTVEAWWLAPGVGATALRINGQRLPDAAGTSGALIVVADTPVLDVETPSFKGQIRRPVETTDVDPIGLLLSLLDSEDLDDAKAFLHLWKARGHPVERTALVHLERLVSGLEP